MIETHEHAGDFQRAEASTTKSRHTVKR